MIRKAREPSPNLKSEFGSPSDHCVMCISQFVGGHVGGRGSEGDSWWQLKFKVSTHQEETLWVREGPQITDPDCPLLLLCLP